MESNEPGVSFSARLGMAFRLLFDSAFAGRVAEGLKLGEARRAPAKPLPPERLHASALALLAALQREGRLVDFLQQDVAGFSDQDVGAAARVVHSGCRKVLQQYFDFEPATPEPEGTAISVPKGFDAQRIRLLGNVAGEPPFRGTLKHHGWVAASIRLPQVSEAINPSVVAPAEVEL